ncbi:MAG TPA: outer membrane beta-barrel protein [Steroidobacteraceae bacterium]|nr:outer membrane beta-barrel protein [Steroidobacteraceae bacterium]
MSHRRSSFLLLLLGLTALLAPAAEAADNGYLVMSVGSARADFTNGTNGSSQLQLRFAGARQTSSHLALELGVSFARGFHPPSDVEAAVPGAHVKVVALDGAALFLMPVNRSARFFLAAGPAMTTARVELSNSEGRSTKVDSHRDFTVMVGGGLDFFRGSYTAVRLAVAHLQTVGSDTAGSTGSSSLNSVSLGILLRF